MAIAWSDSPDFFPTIADLAGEEQEYPMDGVSLYPNLISDRNQQLIPDNFAVGNWLFAHSRYFQE